MGLFTSIQNTKSINRIFLGSPEAEAEAHPNSRIKLLDVYDDHFDLLKEMECEKFMILGKKGSGKSAFAEYVVLIAQHEPNIFAKFIRQNDCNLEHIVQIGKEHGHIFERQHLFSWLILTNLLNLIFSKENDISKEYNLLKQFLKKNSGYIDINENQFKSLIEEKGFEISIEYLRRYFTNKLNKKLSITSEKAPFFKLIPDLKRVIESLLTSREELDNENSYIIFFDDLDISFISRDQGSRESLISLIRTTKELNKEFAQKGIKAKIIILLRDDIYKSISPDTADSAKILGSYGVYINWYQDEYSKSEDETQLYIRKFINRRIASAFTAAGKIYDKTDPWKSLVEEPFKGTNEKNTSFKYILLHTLMRPRDLINFFKPLSNYDYNYPLSKKDIHSLINMYSEQIVTELKNELSNFYSRDEISYIFNSIGEISKKENISYNDAIDILKTNFPNLSQDVSENILVDLFDRSFLGKISENGNTYFKHRESMNETYTLSQSDKIIVHNILKIYCEKKGFGHTP